MDPFYKQDIFFFVTTVAVVLITIISAVVLVYVAVILKDIKYIVRKAKTESDLIGEDLHKLRENVKDEGAKIKHFAKFFSSIYKRNKK